MSRWLTGAGERFGTGWRPAGLCSVVTGHAGDENAAKLTRAQKEQLKETLGGPPSQSGIKADFWDVLALRDVVRIEFGVEYSFDSSYQLLTRFLGMSFKLPDPFDKRRDEAAITARMARIRQEVAELLARGWEVRAVDEVRVEHEVETRRMCLPGGGRTRLRVDRTRFARSFFGALSLTSKKMKVHPIEGDQNAEWMTLAMARPVRGTENEKIAVVLDNAGFHHAKAVTDLYEPDRHWSGSNRSAFHPMPPTTTPRSTSGTPPRPTSQTSSETPRNRPTQPSPTTSPAAPSTTTSNTYQSRHPKETLFNTSHSSLHAQVKRAAHCFMFPAVSIGLAGPTGFIVSRLKIS